MSTRDGKAKLLKLRAGETLEEKRMPRFLESIEHIGTAQEVGTTAVTVMLCKGKLYCANLGDSRAVMAVEQEVKFKDGTSKKVTKAVSLSKDHKPHHKEEQSRILAAGGNISKAGRLNGELAVSRTIGDLQFKSNPKLPPHQ